MSCTAWTVPRNVPVTLEADPFAGGTARRSA